MTAVNVIQYNVMTPNLCNAECLPFHEDEKSLDNEWRFDEICKRFERRIAAAAAASEAAPIICLQEVSVKWCCRLHVFFSKHKYSVVSRLYGTRAATGYMGVLIAYPRATYSKEWVGMKRASEEVAVFPERRRTGWLEWLASGGGPSTRELQDDYVQEARYRMNTAILLRLRCTQNPQCSFVVATYHMPHDYRQPDRMLLYTAMAANIAKNAKVRVDEPVILAGDFNFEPSGRCYEWMQGTKPARLQVSVPYRGETFNALLAQLAEAGSDDDDDDDDDACRWKSAYREERGADPDYTIYTQSKWCSEAPFKGCLDYIWFQNCHVASVVPVGVGDGGADNCSEELELLPSFRNKEPSDHIMLQATFRVPAS